MSATIKLSQEIALHLEAYRKYIEQREPQTALTSLSIQLFEDLDNKLVRKVEILEGKR